MIYCFRGTTLFHPGRVHFRGQHLPALLRELPSVITLLGFRDSHSMVIFNRSAQCLAPSDISLYRPETAYSSISLCLVGCIIPASRTFVNRKITFRTMIQTGSIRLANSPACVKRSTLQFPYAIINAHFTGIVQPGKTQKAHVLSTTKLMK